MDPAYSRFAFRARLLRPAAHDRSDDPTLVSVADRKHLLVPSGKGVSGVGHVGPEVTLAAAGRYLCVRREAQAPGGAPCWEDSGFGELFVHPSAQTTPTSPNTPQVKPFIWNK